LISKTYAGAVTKGIKLARITPSSLSDNHIICIRTADDIVMKNSECDYRSRAVVCLRPCREVTEQIRLEMV